VVSAWERSAWEIGFLTIIADRPIVYKDSTNFRDAHRGSRASRFCGCPAVRHGLK